MTDEEAFQTALEADPGNHALRLIFADWLEDRGDWRAAGYRWMGVHRKWPFWLPHSRKWSWTHPGNAQPEHNHLPRGWYDGLDREVDSDWKKYASRREAEESLCAWVAKVGEPL